MRQFTTPEQTAKLIELGFEKPKCEVKAEQAGDYAWYNPAYSIGELIEMLPPKIETEMEDESDDEYAWLSLEEGWDVLYRSGYYIVERVIHSKELIDALFEMLVQLKVEGVI
jgi:hypothetical protein